MSAISWVVAVIARAARGGRQPRTQVAADPAAALAAMPVFVREVYLLRRVDDLTHAEIALRLGISRAEVRRLLREAVRILDAAS